MLLLALDSQDTREGTNVKMTMFWYIVFMSSLFFCCVVLPFGLYYSETDEGKDFRERLCLAFKQEIVTLVIISLILFPSFAYIKYSWVPVTANLCRTSAFIPADQEVLDTKDACARYESWIKLTVSF